MSHDGTAYLSEGHIAVITTKIEAMERDIAKILVMLEKHINCELERKNKIRIGWIIGIPAVFVSLVGSVIAILNLIYK
jgi:hypothetical protein